MKYLPSLRRSLAATFVAALGLLSLGNAHAATSEFLFTAEGFGLASLCDAVPDCLDVGVVGVADDLAGLNLPIPDSWAQFATVRGFAAGDFSGTWELVDTGAGDNSLFGTLSGMFTVLSPTSAELSIDYLVDGGRGMFSGATGTGASTASLDTDTFDYVESGSFTVMVVPEPTTVALMLAGFLCIGYRARSRNA